MIKFNCVFRSDQECPVKTAYKLAPESLVEFCAICHINPINIPEPMSAISRIDPIIVVLEHLPTILDMYLKLDKEDKKQLWEVMLALSEIRTK
ncbi:hypothetical protein ES702_00582 [subsurface metagenome]